MNNQILATLRDLDALSSDGVSIHGRYLKFSFGEENSAQVTAAVRALQNLDASRIRDEDIEYSANQTIRELHFAKSGLPRIYSQVLALNNEYFSSAINNQLTEDHQLFLLADRAVDTTLLYDKFNNLQTWINLFKEITGNYRIESSNNKITFYLVETLEDDKKIKTHELEISNTETVEQLLNIGSLPSQVDFGNDENYAAEKKLICKSALLKSVKSQGNQSKLLRIMINSEFFVNTFMNNYEFYIKKFSIDKFTRDIETTKIEYFEKINSIIHDNQAKALSIPVVILGTSLLRSWNVMSAVLILTAMVLALYLVVLNLEHKMTAIEDCKKSAKKALNHIADTTSTERNLSTSSELADNIYTEIETKSEKAVSLLKNIRIGVFSASLVWLIYMVCFYLSSTSTCPLS